MAPTAAIAASRSGPARSKASSTSPVLGRARQRSRRARRQDTCFPYARSAAGRRVAGASPAARARSQRFASRRSVSVTAIFATRSPRRRSPSSAAGMTRVSFRTRTSPRRSSSGSSRTMRSCSGSPARTTSSRAESRGAAGRSAISVLGQLEIEQIGTHQCLRISRRGSAAHRQAAAPRPATRPSVISRTARLNSPR